MADFLIGFWVGVAAIIILIYGYFKWDEIRHQKQFSQQQQGQQKRHPKS